MSSIDLGVYVSSTIELVPFSEIATKIGLTGFTAQTLDNSPIKHLESGISVLRRSDVIGRGLSAIKRKIAGVRKQSMIVAIPLTTVEIANWAAEDSRVDLLTVDPTRNHRFRETTAHLAASSNTCLEIQFAPLLGSIGLERSKILKVYREAVERAINAGMPIILSSGARHPLGMRSAMAMRHIGLLLGMKSKFAETAVTKTPFEIMERNQRRFSPEYIDEGIEVVRRGGEDG
ncbi:MAG: RNase P subunit p30 family protein [Promethearchaeota archaeon]